MAQKYVFGSIHPVGIINEFIPGPLRFQGKSADVSLLPKRAQIPFLCNGSKCLFIDNSTTWIYNASDDSWYIQANSGGGQSEYELAENQEV